MTTKRDEMRLKDGSEGADGGSSSAEDRTEKMKMNKSLRNKVTVNRKEEESLQWRRRNETQRHEEPDRDVPIIHQQRFITEESIKMLFSHSRTTNGCNRDGSVIDYSQCISGENAEIQKKKPQQKQKETKGKSETKRPWRRRREDRKWHQTATEWNSEDVRGSFNVGEVEHVHCRKHGVKLLQLHVNH